MQSKERGRYDEGKRTSRSYRKRKEGKGNHRDQQHPNQADPAVDKNHVGEEQRGRERVEQETSREQ